MFPGWKFYKDQRGKEQRLKNLEFLILSMINAEGPTNGYQIIKDLKKRFKGLWNPSPGTIYNQLDKLETKDLIQGNIVDSDEKEHLKSKNYTVTDRGREVLTDIISVETAERELEALGDYIKTIMKGLEFDERVGPFFRFMAPLFEVFEVDHQNADKTPKSGSTNPREPRAQEKAASHGQHRCQGALHCYPGFFQAIRDFKRAMHQYEEEIHKAPAGDQEESPSSTPVNIRVEGEDDEE